MGRKTASRIDPLQIGRIPIYEAREPEGEIRWTANEEMALQEGTNNDGSPKYKRFKVSTRARGVPSEINHSNVTPDMARHRGANVRLGRDMSGESRTIRDRDELPGGVTFEYAKHTAVLSLAALRKLHFPLDGSQNGGLQARTVLAALGMFALTELRRSDYDLRSRCALVLEGAPTLEIVKRDGTTEPFVLDEATAEYLLGEAVRGLPPQLAWQTDPVMLTPSRALVDLIIQSRRLGAVEADGGEEAEDEVSAEV